MRDVTLELASAGFSLAPLQKNASAPWEATLGRVLLKGPRPISSQGEEYLTKLLGYLSPSNRCLD